MNNFYIAFVVYLNLLFVGAKLWGQVEWSWLWVMAPMIALTLIGLLVTMSKGVGKKDSNSINLMGLKEVLENARERSENRH